MARPRADGPGRPVRPGERACVDPLSRAGWFSVQLSFAQPGYERFLTNYSYLNLRTNTWKGEPVLDTGDILLQPAPK